MQYTDSVYNRHRRYTITTSNAQPEVDSPVMSAASDHAMPPQSSSSSAVPEAPVASSVPQASRLSAMSNMLSMTVPKALKASKASGVVASKKAK